MTGVRHYRELIAWQLAERFQQRVFNLIENSRAAKRDLEFRNQLLNAASDVSKDVCEGFLRCSPRVFANFLDYALGSLVEAERRLTDGIGRSYFEASDCTEAFLLAKRCLTAMIRLKQSQIRYARQNQGRRQSPRRPRHGRAGE